MTPAAIERAAVAHDRAADTEDMAGNVYASGKHSGQAAGMRETSAGMLAPIHHEHLYFSCIWTEAVFALGVLLAGGGIFLSGLALYVVCA